MFFQKNGLGFARWSWLLLGILYTPLTWAQFQTEEKTLIEQLGVFGEIMRWLVAIGLFVFFIFVALLLAKIVASRIKTRSKNQLHQEVIILVERVTSFSIIVLGAVIAFASVGVNMTWILGPLTFGLGFAFKDILANVIAGIMILGQSKFKMGDILEVNGQLGKVTRIEMRSTDIQAFDGTNLVVPNADLLTNVVQNFTANDFRRLDFQVGVHYATPLKQAIEIAQNALKQHQSVSPDPSPQVLVTEFGESAMLLEVRFWIEADDQWWVIQSECIQLVKQAFDQAGITIPFPIRTLSLDRYDAGIAKALDGGK